jgi:predicted glycogen debranching enzyme
VIVGQKEFRLSTNKFPHVYFPRGYQFIDSFTMEDYPVTRFRFGDVCIEESLLMPCGEESVLVRYDIIEGDKALVLKAIPLISYRSIHSLHHENLCLRPRTCEETSGFSISPYGGMPVLSITTSTKSDFFPSPTWWYHFEYTEERRRGYDFHEDLFAPGIFEIKLEEGDSVILLATINEKKSSAKDISSLWENEIKRIKNTKKKYTKTREPLKTLITQALHYLVSYPHKDKGIIAGYPWFREWGRDTMISLTGLTLCNKDFESARNILTKYTKHITDGLMPNIISEDGHHSYNAIDTSLFFFWALEQYCEYTNDYEFPRTSLLPPSFLSFPT